MTTSAYTPNHDAKPLCTLTASGPTLYVIVLCQLVMETRQAVKLKILDAIERGARDVTIDLSHCVASESSYGIDGTGLGMLVSLQKQLRDRGGSLVLTNLTASAHELFDLTKLGTVFTIRDERAA